MAQKHQIDQEKREQKQLHYLAAPLLGDRFPKVRELVVHVHFSDPKRKATPSPYQRIFASDMRLYFDFACPLRDCVDGGFDLNAKLEMALSEHDNDHADSIACTGKRKRSGGGDECCGLELRYRITIQTNEKRRPGTRTSRSVLPVVASSDTG